MHPLRQPRLQPGREQLTAQPVPRSALEQVVNALEIDPDQIERFLGPRDDIIAAIRAGAAHRLMAVRSGQDLVGFYVIHPDRRDGACWWLGWFALDRRHQGQGLGRASMTQIMRRFRHIPNCRRIRLLVAPENAPALRLYTQAGFQDRGPTPSGERLLETTIARPSARRHPTRHPRNTPRPGHRSRPGRLRLLAGPYAARVIGVERGPPTADTRPHPG